GAKVATEPTRDGHAPDERASRWLRALRGDSVMEPGAAHRLEDIVTKAMITLSALALLAVGACLPDNTVGSPTGGGASGTAAPGGNGMTTGGGGGGQSPGTAGAGVTTGAA